VIEDEVKSLKQTKKKDQVAVPDLYGEALLIKLLGEERFREIKTQSSDVPTELLPYMSKTEVKEIKTSPAAGAEIST